ncbi:hypothetical protein [Candidatus Protochlamydia sp. R18]|uniref:hypothetical protein n=1 Tax=Candidatus Protochlamydia sp. R18 TaxID=1353977 RepID=UPI0005AB5414|nr:hypothetical protein [Candidatus Protochlamydia sp. R18]
MQKKAHDIFYQGLRNGLMQELGVSKCDLFVYETTGGSNLELPDMVISTNGELGSPSFLSKARIFN